MVSPRKAPRRRARQLQRARTVFLLLVFGLCWAFIALKIWANVNDHPAAPRAGRLRGIKTRPRASRATGARLAMCVPYVGSRLPTFFKAFAASCRASAGAVDYLVLLSDGDAVPPEARAFLRGAGPAPRWLPPNVRLIAVGERRFARLHARIPDAGAGAGFPSDGPLDEGAEPLAAALYYSFRANPRQLVEFKPAIGVVFSEYLANYSHWAFGDMDVLMGATPDFLEAEELEAFDVFSWGFGDTWRAYARGQWTAHRNAPVVNGAYLRCAFLGEELQSRLLRKAHYESAEGCYSTALAAAGLRFRIATKHFTDAAKHGDADAAWLVDGEVRRCLLDGPRPCRPLAPKGPPPRRSNAAAWEVVRRLPARAKRCMGWVNPSYQICLDGGDYGPGDDVVLERDGTYRRRRGPEDAGLSVPSGGYATAAFFHLQEWKKKYRSYSAPAHALPGGARLVQGTSILATRYGLIPAPPLRPRPPEDVLRDALADADAAEYCAFKSCKDIPAFQRGDLGSAFSPHKDAALEEGGPPAALAPERGVGLVQALALDDEAAPALLKAAGGNACDWPGPATLVVAVGRPEVWDRVLGDVRGQLEACGRVKAPSVLRTVDSRMHGAKHTPRATLVLARVANGVQRVGKALLNVGLDNCPARRCLFVEAGARLFRGAYGAIERAAADAPPGRTLLLPAFRVPRDAYDTPDWVLRVMGRTVGDVNEEEGMLRHLLGQGVARRGGAGRCGAAVPLSEAAYRRWDANDASPGAFAELLPDASLPLEWGAPGPALVIDQLDARGDRRLVRVADEHRRQGCFDGLLVRALATHHSADFAVVPGAFVVGVDEDAAKACGCTEGGGGAPDGGQSKAVVDYGAYLERAAAVRGDADAEARARATPGGDRWA